MFSKTPPEPIIRLPKYIVRGFKDNEEARQALDPISDWMNYGGALILQGDVTVTPLPAAEQVLRRCLYCRLVIPEHMQHCDHCGGHD